MNGLLPSLSTFIYANYAQKNGAGRGPLSAALVHLKKEAGGEIALIQLGPALAPFAEVKAAEFDEKTKEQAGEPNGEPENEERSGESLLQT